MTREEKLQKAHQMFDNRNLLTELKWQREYFKRGYVSNQEELFNLWIFDECIKVLEQEPTTKIEESNFSQEQYKADIQSAYDCGKSVIDKIRAEIEQLRIHKAQFLTNDNKVCIDSQAVLDILDKYKGGSEG